MDTIQINPEQWIFQYLEYLKNYASSKLSDEALIEDLVQDTFLAALKSVDNFRGDASERTWLVSILKRKIIDQYRSENSRKGQFNKRMIRQSALEEIYHKEISMDTSNNYQAEVITKYTDLQKIVIRAKQDLTNKECKVFELKVIKDYDTKVICEKLSISQENFWVIMHRARKKIQKTIHREWFN